METDRRECTFAGNMGGPFLNEDGSNESEVVAGCDPGIREVVKWLRRLEFDTTDSGDGKAKFEQGFVEDDGVCPFPHVSIAVEPSLLVDTADRLASLLRTEFGIEVQPTPPEGDPPRIDASYCPASKVAMLLLLNVDDLMLKSRDVLITVCKECRQASCWYGMFMCDNAREADTIEVPRLILLQEKREHADYLTNAMYERHCGCPPPPVPAASAVAPSI